MSNRIARWLAVALATALLVPGVAYADAPEIKDGEIIEYADTVEEAVAEVLPGALEADPELSDPELSDPELSDPEAANEPAPAVVANPADPEFVIENGVLVAYNGPGGNVVIPGGVTAIGEDAFDGNEAIKHVTLPSGLKTIGEGAFCWARNLESLTVPEGTQTIDNRAFEGCIGLKEIMIPASVTTIGPGNFVYWDDDGDGLRVLPKLTIFGYLGSRAESFAKHAYVDKYDDDYLGNMVIPFRALIDKAEVTAAAKTYTGRALKTTVRVKLGGKTLVGDKDYKVTYKNNKKVGLATVTVKGVGAYAGTATGAFEIDPKPVAGLKLTAGKKQITVKWKKGSGVSGYELQYALKKNFASATEVTVKKAATVKSVLKNLSAKKTYYVRIRAFQNVGGNTFRSAWSAAKKVKVK